MPPYPSISNDVLDFIQQLDNETYDTNLLYSLCPPIRYFFESLGASWNEWKGQRVSKQLLKTLAEKTKSFSKKKFRRSL